MTEWKTVYVPHPVTPETKAKHNAAGERIVDIRFAPAGYKAAPDVKETAPIVSDDIVAEAEPIAETENDVEVAEPKRRGRRKRTF